MTDATDKGVVEPENLPKPKPGFFVPFTVTPNLAKTGSMNPRNPSNAAAVMEKGRQRALDASLGNANVDDQSLPSSSVPFCATPVPGANQTSVSETTSSHTKPSSAPRSGNQDVSAPYVDDEDSGASGGKWIKKFFGM